MHCQYISDFFPTAVVGPALGAGVVYVCLEDGDLAEVRQRVERSVRRVHGEARNAVRYLPCLRESLQGGNIPWIDPYRPSDHPCESFFATHERDLHAEASKTMRSHESDAKRLAVAVEDAVYELEKEVAPVIKRHSR